MRDTMMTTRTEKLAALAAVVGDDGTGDLGVIIDASGEASVDERERA